VKPVSLARRAIASGLSSGYSSGSLLEIATTPIALTPAVAGVTLVSGIANVGAIFAFLTALAREDLSVVGPL
jgi:hypothetical protein